MAIANSTTETLIPNVLRYQSLEQTAEFFQLDSNLRQQIFGISPRNQARLRKDNAILNPLVVDRFNRFKRITQQAINLWVVRSYIAEARYIEGDAIRPNRRHCR
jgi:uncharacterized protein (DUF2384 family)